MLILHVLQHVLGDHFLLDVAPGSDDGNPAAAQGLKQVIAGHDLTWIVAAAVSVLGKVLSIDRSAEHLAGFGVDFRESTAPARLVRVDNAAMDSRRIVGMAARRDEVLSFSFARLLPHMVRRIVPILIRHLPEHRRFLIRRLGQTHGTDAEVERTAILGYRQRVMSFSGDWAIEDILAIRQPKHAAAEAREIPGLAALSNKRAARTRRAGLVFRPDQFAGARLEELCPLPPRQKNLAVDKGRHPRVLAP